MKDIESDKKWVLRHCPKIECPECTGKRPERLSDCIVQCSILCPKCNRVWRYKIDISREVKKRVVMWSYSYIQPFLSGEIK